MGFENNDAKLFVFVTDGKGDYLPRLSGREEEKKDQSTPKEVLDHVLTVGTKKAMGYLPVYEIEGYCDSSVDEIIRLSEEKGLKTILFEANPIRSKNLYVYDDDLLQKILNRHIDLLLENDWPTDSKSFVLRVNSEDVKPKTKLYELIENCFTKLST